MAALTGFEPALYILKGWSPKPIRGQRQNYYVLYKLDAASILEIEEGGL